MRLIDADKAIENVNSVLADYVPIFPPHMEGIPYKCAKAIVDTPTGWIPVSERLPEDSGEYLISYDFNAVDIVWFAHKDDYFTDESEWRDIPAKSKVVAWMPLPKPYKAD